MKNRILTAAAVLAFVAPVPGSAEAELIAGWDFSQYFGDGFLTIDAATFTAVLDANYSDLDPTFNAGAESAAFGTMYIDGSFGSTSVPGLGTGTETFFPTAAAPGSLVSNLTAPTPNPFDSFTILTEEGQEFTSLLAMSATDTFSVVFEATLESISENRQGWVLSFGGRTFSGTSNVSVDFSTDGSSYSPVATVNLDSVDTRFAVDLGDDLAEAVYVRLTLDPSVGQPIIDNVAIEAPEPGAALSIATVLAGLGVLRRRTGVAAA
ncbi:MAG: hypothetical protein ACQGVK_11250 [Myxococcota bacterium]